MLIGVFSQKFLILFNFHPSSDSLPCQILPEEIPMQEQESDSLFIENDPAVADIQSADSPDKRTGPLSTKGWKSSLDRLS